MSTEIANLQWDESERLRALERYKILDTESEAVFDDLARIAAQICGVPIALISLLDDKRQWFKSKLGLEVAQTERDIAFCNHAIYQPGIFEVPDALGDERFAANPLVTGDPHIRFYAGAPLVTPDGYPLGTLCVIDRQPRDLTPDQRSALQALANQVVAQLELRRALAQQRVEDRRHRLILESAVDYAIISMDLSGMVTSWNVGAQKILGWTSEEMCGRPCDDFFTPEDRAAGVPKSEILSALTADRGSDERWHLRKDGSRFWASGEMMPLRDDDDHAVGLIKILRDRTTQRLADLALSQSEERYRSLYNAIDTGFCIIEMKDRSEGGPSDYRFLETNAAFEQQAGFKAAIGQWMRDIAPDHEQHWFDIYEHVAATGTPIRFEQQAAALGDRWFDVFAYPVGESGTRQVAVLFTDITRRRRDEARIRQLNERLESEVAERTQELSRVWQNSQDIMLVIGLDAKLRSVNPAATKVLGWSADELIGKSILDFIHPDDHPPLIDGSLVAARYQGDRVFRNRYLTKSGDYRSISWAATGENGLIYAYGRDVTAESEQAKALRETEERLRQSQKMEAVGQLTGGLAHDFNNLLAAISGSLEMLESNLAQGKLDAANRYIAAAQAAAQRAAALTHRLLAFSRRQTLDARVIDVNQLVATIIDLIQRTVGPQIQMEVVALPEDCRTIVDPHQLENALLNLCINARDAMPMGGKIIIETSAATITEQEALQYDIAAGAYIALCVKDTGTGMDRETVERAFDPFFTTKPLGEGTGLGLSMIYGFARQSGGHARIFSTMGEGTTVCIYLPRDSNEAQLIPAPSRRSMVQKAAGAGEVILIVDDEETVRMILSELLEDCGYGTLVASDGPSALRIVETSTHIDLLVTDVGLPGGMNGRQVADAARARRPGLKVLFITGYAESAVVSSRQLGAEMQILTKPFTMGELTQRVNHMLKA